MRVLNICHRADDGGAAERERVLQARLRQGGHDASAADADLGTWTVVMTGLGAPPPDVVLAETRTDGAALAAWLVAWLRRAPLVVDGRFDEGWANGGPRGMRRFVAMRAMRVLAASEAEKQALAAAGLDSGRIGVVDAVVSERAAGAPAAADDGDANGGLDAVLVEVHRLARGRDIASRPRGLYGFLRRVADMLIAATMLILLSPLLLIVALAIRIDSPGPALFRQRRIGRASSEFTILKFRTMKVGTADLASHLMGPGSSRVTRLGRFLRRTSIDELPQLWNVLSGGMTLIGPRPALYNQYDLIALRQAVDVDALKPGVTGWAQIHGRDDIPIPVKVEYDRYYLEHLSPWLNVRIALRTLLILFSDRGVY
jgi:O-antigen biosynthesis protein WbqP